MAAQDAAPERELLVNRLARLTGATTLARRLLDDDRRAAYSGPYVYLLGVLLLDLAVLSPVQWVRYGFYPPISNPPWVLLPVGTAYAVFATRRLVRRSATLDESLFGGPPGRRVGDAVLERLPARGGSDDGGSGNDPGAPTAGVVPRWLQSGLLLVALAVYFGWMALNPDLVATIVEAEGALIGPFKWFVLIPVTGVVVIAEFAATVVAVNVLLPTEIVASKPDVRVGEPGIDERLQSVGKLLVRSTTFYFVGLTVYTTSVFSTDLLAIDRPWPEPGPIAVAFFVAAWTLGVLLFALPVEGIRRYVKAVKDERIREVWKLTQGRGPGDDGPDGEMTAAEYARQHIRLTRLQGATEYPVDVTILQEFLAIAVIPLLQQLVFGVVLPAGGG